ncbi:MAG: sulfatase-like hydrolase/transferase [Lentisphaeraceae bacterium]|nr:sulfatase-like hydrolase/transferase [Lentisphaeraceae bacterium]
MATFAAMVDSVDQNIGRVISDLKKNDEFENTIIFFLSDNGACAEWDPHGFDDNPYPNNKLHHAEELDLIGQRGYFHSYGTAWANTCNTPFTSYKHYTYEGGISAPMIIHYPKELKKTGTINRQPSHVADIAATIIDIAGAKYPQTRNGQQIFFY